MWFKNGLKAQKLQKQHALKGHVGQSCESSVKFKFKIQSKKLMKFIGIWMASMILPSGLHAATWLKNLKVEYRNTPLAVGVMHPRFA